MSESIELVIEARGREFEVDIAGLASLEDLQALVEECWDDIWVGEEPRHGDDASTLVAGDWKVLAGCVEDQHNWLVGEDESDPENWEWEWIEFLGNNGCIESDVAEAAFQCGITPDTVEDAYNGLHSSSEEFVKQLLEDTGSVPADIPNYVYIDWARSARDVMMDYSESGGHYFRQM